MKTRMKTLNRSLRSRQRGVTLLFGMIALVVMLIGAVAMMRSMQTALLMSGNLGFGRDLTNQAERATVAASALFNTGALATEVPRITSLVGSNYSATILPTTAQGIPTALANETQFAAVGTVANDITVAAQSVTVRYLIDRLCTNATAADLSHCTLQESLKLRGGSTSQQTRAETDTVGGAGALPPQTVYRLTVRVTGPRNTQAFYQTTFAL
jgi:type IV pilus assembly protein PilX